MSTLTDLIAEALREHPDATDRSADDGCWCRTPGTAGRYDQHAAAIIATVVGDWLESDETTFALQVAGPRSMEQVRTALAAEALKGADQ